MTDQPITPEPADENGTKLELTPLADGISHINVFMRGETELGREASNLSDRHLNHPLYGHFRTAEGLWFYLTLGKNDEIFRVLSGYDARKRGKEQKKQGKALWNEHFHREFKIGMLAKLMGNPQLQEMLKNSSLKLVHYYYFGKDKSNVKVVVPSGHDWQVDFLTSMRARLKKGLPLEPVMNGLLLFILEKAQEDVEKCEDDFERQALEGRVADLAEKIKVWQANNLKVLGIL